MNIRILLNFPTYEKERFFQFNLSVRSANRPIYLMDDFFQSQKLPIAEHWGGSDGRSWIFFQILPLILPRNLSLCRRGSRELFAGSKQVPNAV